MEDMRQPERIPTQPDRQVRVACGALTGLECVVLSRLAASRLLLGVNEKKGVYLELDDSVLEPAER